MPEDYTNTTSATINPPLSTDGQGDDMPTPIIPDLPPVQDGLGSAAADVASAPAVEPVDNSKIIADVAAKIGESHNILVALSSDPSVDELCAAIGTSLFLDRLGKRVTAIYSGSTPNALEFLKPEETFEHSADALQDFVIALNKEKADHLRYKLDGDYVKIFITPYRSRISSEDLEFSYGDYNVDLVLALDVANGVDLDAALREHGRIMHDAVVINITTGKPGKLGEIEWSDKTASSVSEMIAELLYGVGSKEKIEKEEATAFLTGIVAATNRFASASTTPRTMKLASRLMESGANQQLISKNITPDIENEFFNFAGVSEKADGDPTKLDISHGDNQDDEEKEVEGSVNEKESTLLADLKAAEASLANAGAEVEPEVTREPLRLDSEPSFPTADLSEPDSPSATATKQPILPEPASDKVPEPTPETVSEPTPGPLVAASSVTEAPAPELNPSDAYLADKPEKVVTPSANFNPESLNEGTNKYGRMLEDALADAEPEASTQNVIYSSVPDVASEPEINGVPEINYMPMPGDEILPPPPTPPIDFGVTTSPTPEMPSQSAAPAGTASPVEPAAPTPAEPTSLGPQPAMQDQVYAPQAARPDAFKIPGM